VICDKIANIVGSRISSRKVQRRPKSSDGQPGITALVQAACGGHRIHCRSRQACIHTARAAEACAAGTSKHEVQPGQRKKQEEGDGGRRAKCEQRQRRRPALRPAQLKCGSVLPATRHAGTRPFANPPTKRQPQRVKRHSTNFHRSQGGHSTRLTRVGVNCLLLDGGGGYCERLKTSRQFTRYSTS
jgi:hypothetical protein